VDGEVKQIEKGMKASRYKVHNIEIVVDRITVDDKARPRIADSVEVALKFGEGVLIVNDGKNDQLFSQKYSCTYCGISYEEPAPNSFSFNSPAGHCTKCEGLGELKAFDLNLIMPDENLSINKEGIAALGKSIDLEKTLATLIENRIVPKGTHWEKVPFYKPRQSGDGEGYEGRIGIYEVMGISSAIRDLVMRGATTSDLEKQARSEGMLTMLEDGIFKCAQGITTLEEVMRVVSE
jgi:hypothetical protein